MIREENHFDCLVIGAGVAGLTTAGELQQAGMKVVLLEQSDSAGGRLSTLKFNLGSSIDSHRQAAFDHGAQYFTARDDRFIAVVEKWEELGIVRQWSRGFAISDGSMYRDGQPRYRGTPDMNSVPSLLADNLDIRPNTKAARIRWQHPSWRVFAEDGSVFRARTLVISTPVPVTLELLREGNVELPTGAKRILQRMEYEPCIALLLLLDGPSQMPFPGGMWSVGEPISWMADNYLKGVSQVEGAVTIHAGPEFSEQHWEAEDAMITRKLAKAAGEWLGAPIAQARVVKWTYSKPIVIYPEPCLLLEQPGPLILIGDAFAGPRVEGAFLSGLAAAAHLP